MSGGTKLFRNNTGQDITVTLFVREGENPANTAGTVVFKMGEGEESRRSYGADTNSPFLNGIGVTFHDVNGNKTYKQRLVTQRGNNYDSVLNTNNTIDIGVRPGMKFKGSNA